MRTHIDGVTTLYLERYTIITGKLTLTGKGTIVRASHRNYFAMERPSMLDALEWVMKNIVDDMQGVGVSYDAMKLYAQDLKTVLWHIDHERLKIPPKELC